MSANPSEILIDLSTAILRQHDERLQCRLVGEASATQAKRLPFGPFMPDQHRTMEIGLRHWVREQVGVDLAHVEQLYTFADQGRHASGEAAHIVSVGYLALTRTREPDKTPPEAASEDGDWQDLYAFFPWEDWRQGRPELLDAQILPALDKWLEKDAQAADRVRLAFGREGAQWDEEFVLERYELLYEAALVEEALIDQGKRGRQRPKPALGLALHLDHRRILATALGRLRSKLKYRPVIFDLMPAGFTLRALQSTTEMVMGVNLHQQNFRRLVEKSGFLISTGRTQRARGRPAEVFRLRHNERTERPLSGLRVSAGRAKPNSK